MRRMIVQIKLGAQRHRFTGELHRISRAEDFNIPKLYKKCGSNPLQDGPHIEVEISEPDTPSLRIATAKEPRLHIAWPDDEKTKPFVCYPLRITEEVVLPFFKVWCLMTVSRMCLGDASQADTIVGFRHDWEQLIEVFERKEGLVVDHTSIDY